MRLRFWREKTPPLDLTPYVGQWVAVKDGRLLGHARTAYDIVEQMRQLGSAGNGAAMWYQQRPEDVRRWGVVWPPQERPGPNCRFRTREEAEAWAKSWAHIKGEGIIVPLGPVTP